MTELRQARLTGIRVAVPVEALEGRLSGLPAGVVVERDRIEVRYAGANPTSATRRGFRRKSRILAPRPTRCASETGGFRVRGLPEPRVVPTYPLD